MARWVLLRHDLPDGSWHHDWMMEDPARPGGPLLTFRLPSETKWPPSGDFVGWRIGAHRREYLEYEGPVSRDRGSVRRLDSGECEVMWDGADRLAILLRTPDGRGHRIRGRWGSVPIRQGQAPGQVAAGVPADAMWEFDLENPPSSGILAEGRSNEAREPTGPPRPDTRRANSIREPHDERHARDATDVSDR